MEWAPSLLAVAVAVAVAAMHCFRRYTSAPRRAPFTTTTTEWRAAFMRHAQVFPGTLACEERRAMLRQVASPDAAAAAVAAFEPAEDLPYAEFLRILEQHGTPC